MKKVIYLMMAAFLVTSCSDSNDSGTTKGTSLSMKVSQTPIAKTAADTLTLDTVKVLMKNIKFKVDDDFEDSLDFKIGPFVLYLNLTGNLTTIGVSDIPAGTYNKVKFKIHKPEDDETVSDPEFKTGTSGDERFSVIIKGHYFSSPFVYKSKKSIEQELWLNPPLVVADSISSTNVTLSVSTFSWFRDEDGSIMDPANSENDDTIDDNIKDSFKAYKDDDKDGDDDDDDDDK